MTSAAMMASTQIPPRTSTPTADPDSRNMDDAFFNMMPASPIQGSNAKFPLRLHIKGGKTTNTAATTQVPNRLLTIRERILLQRLDKLLLPYPKITKVLQTHYKQQKWAIASKDNKVGRTLRLNTLQFLEKHVKSLEMSLRCKQSEAYDVMQQLLKSHQQRSKKSPTQHPPTQMSFTQPLPNQMSATQPLPNQMSSTQPLPSQMSSTQPLPNQMSATQPLPNQISSTQPLPNQMSATQPLPNQMSATQPLPNQMSSTQPLPNQMSSTQPLPNQMSYTQPLPNQMSSTQPLPNQMSATQPLTNQMSSTQPLPNQMSATQPLPNQMSSTQHPPNLMMYFQQPTARPTPTAHMKLMQIVPPPQPSPQPMDLTLQSTQRTYQPIVPQQPMMSCMYQLHPSPYVLPQYGVQPMMAYPAQHRRLTLWSDCDTFCVLL